MSTLTPVLDLVLPADNEPDWGTSYNANFTTLDDSALVTNISGVGFVQVLKPGNGLVVISGSDTNITDHGALSGLTDDDHTQYVLANGTRAFSSTVAGVTPASSAHLATKGYVDTTDTTISGFLQAQIHGKSFTDHTHDASALTSGTLPTARISSLGVVQHQGALTHSGIGGLSADDHPHYFNAARGDARYVHQALIGAGKVTVTSGTDEIIVSGTETFASELDHGGLLGLLDHDHLNYPHKLLNETVSGTWTFLNGVTVSGLPVNTNNDHGTLQGLSDDDHPQYFLADGSRSLTGNVSFGTPLLTVAGIRNQDLLDLSANETVSGTWNFSGGLTVSGSPVVLNTFAGLTETIDGHIETPTSGTVYYLRHKAAFPLTILELAGQTDVGTLSVTLKVNSTAATGIDAASITTGGNIHTASSNNTVVAGDVIKLEMTSAPSNANDFRFSVKTRRT